MHACRRPALLILLAVLLLSPARARFPSANRGVEAQLGEPPTWEDLGGPPATTAALAAAARPAAAPIPCNIATRSGSKTCYNSYFKPTAK